MIIKYYNAEIETMLRPWINQPKIVERALPKEISFFGETCKSESYKSIIPLQNWTRR